MSIEMVNHPKHYVDASVTIEPIDVMDCLPCNYANAFKYVVRAGKKDPNKYFEDLKKAEWYLERAMIFKDEHCYKYPNKETEVLLKLFAGKSNNIILSNTYSEVDLSNFWESFWENLYTSITEEIKDISIN